MTRKLSNWSKPGEKPPMVGVWETDPGGGLRGFNYWDGECYGPTRATPFQAFLDRGLYKGKATHVWRFRGLARKPE